MDNEVYLHREYKKFSLNDDLTKPLSLYQSEVHSDWIDYNGHMSESFYLYALAMPQMLFFAILVLMKITDLKVNLSIQLRLI